MTWERYGAALTSNWLISNPGIPYIPGTDISLEVKQDDGSVKKLALAVVDQSLPIVARMDVGYGSCGIVFLATDEKWQMVVGDNYSGWWDITYLVDPFVTNMQLLIGKRLIFIR